MSVVLKPVANVDRSAAASGRADAQRSAPQRELLAATLEPSELLDPLVP